MRRTELLEIHDHPLCPQFLRDLVTDALEALWTVGNSYKPILPQLHAAFKTGIGACAEFQVVDLCSGGGGPWQGLARDFEARHGVPVRVSLTDKYPNSEATKRLRGQGNIRYLQEPVDAMQVPSTLSGFRTMFSSFHHFGLEDARAVLSDAVNNGRGIGIFEVPSRSLKTLFMVCLTPWLVAGLTPQIRPFRWSRLFWTYVVPAVPFIIWSDGCMSCFRAYSEGELREMVQGDLTLGYDWQIGVAEGGLLPVTYLVGLPKRDSWPVESPKQSETSKAGGTR